jgi:hypothetical protein
MDKDSVGKGEHTQRISRSRLDAMEMKTIPVICPWCNKIFKLSTWEVDKDKKTGVTHGICPECFEKTLSDACNPDDSAKMRRGSGVDSPKGIKTAAVKETTSNRFRNFFKLKK